MSHPTMRLEVRSRKSGYMTGGELVAYLVSRGVNFGEEREEILLEQYSRGNVPQFLRTLYPFEMHAGDDTYILYCLPDYLCVGSNEDFVHTPMAPATAQRIADEWGLVIGTPEMEDARRAYFPQRLGFRPMAPPEYPRDGSMMHTSRWPIHTRWFLEDMKKAGYTVGLPVTGHKKCIITHPWLVVWGFAHCGVHGAYYTKSDKAIHVFEENARAHIPKYSDYSHGAMLYHPTVFRLNADGAAEAAGQTIIEKVMSKQPKPLSRRQFSKSPRYPV